MRVLSEEGRQVVQDLANRHGFSFEAVATMLDAVAAGYGSQAQFSHPEFGGMGQWSAGGMIMIGDMFNNHLAGRVSSLCQELSGLVQQDTMFTRPAQSQSQSQGHGGFAGQMQGQGSWSGPGVGGETSGQMTGASLFVPGDGSGQWWPTDFGQPSSVGGQNDLRYAVFPMARRLVIDIAGRRTAYDTGEHQIGGVSQQQGGDQSLTLTSQFGTVRLSDLPVVSLEGEADISATFSSTPQAVASSAQTRTLASTYRRQQPRRARQPGRTTFLR